MDQTDKSGCSNESFDATPAVVSSRLPRVFPLTALALLELHIKGLIRLTRTEAHNCIDVVFAVLESANDVVGDNPVDR